MEGAGDTGIGLGPSTRFWTRSSFPWPYCAKVMARSGTDLDSRGGQMRQVRTLVFPDPAPAANQELVAFGMVYGLTLQVVQV